MKSTDYDGSSSGVRQPFYYGWVIVAACTIQQAMQYGIQYSFGIFFKPMIAEFGWSRAALSGVYSVSMLCGGLLAIPAGWLADKIGPAKVVAACSLLMGLGLVLTSQINDLGQLYITYGIIVGIGSSGIFAVSSGITARWFFKRRGFALGIVSAGVGLGTLTIPPIAEYLIRSFGWSMAYLIIGITSSVILVGSSLFLRRDPRDIGLVPYGSVKLATENTASQVPNLKPAAPDAGLSVWEACRTLPLWMIVGIFIIMNGCTQMIILHLANYATDIGISPITAATVVSVIGIGSIFGRLIMGTGSDKIGNNNTLIICGLIQTASLCWLIFSGDLWMLYIFAVTFSFAYGGEVPLMTLLMSERFGLRSVSALVGVLVLATRIGAALGSLVGGTVFDATNSYTAAFIIAASSCFVAVMGAFALKKTKKYYATR